MTSDDDPPMGALLLLAGGYSRRFGEADKALADLAGKPLSRHAADRCVLVTDRTVVSCRPAQRDRLEAAFRDHDSPVAVVGDPVVDGGPLTGIREGLEAIDSAYALVLACDMPFVAPELVAHLFERAAGEDGAIPRAHGRRQPTCAVYHVERALAAAEEALGRDDRRTLTLPEDLAAETVEESTARSLGGPDCFRNVNTREAFDRAARRLPATASRRGSRHAGGDRRCPGDNS